MGKKSRAAKDERKANTSLELWREINAAPAVKSGAAVNWKTALEVTTVLRCASVIADGVATVPVKVFRKTDTGRVPEADHALYELLTVAPNEWQNSLEFRETLAFHLALCGNSYCFINRVRGVIVELIPIEPGHVTVKQGNDYVLTYEVQGIDGRQRPFPAETIWHMRGPSWNGVIGLETVRLAREAIGLAVVTEEAHARLHSNSAQPGGIYSVDGVVPPEQYKVLRDWVVANTTGDNRGKPMILDRGAKWTATGMNGVDAQHLETRRFQIEEICRAMGVMPIMVGASDKTATYASAEQMFLAHAVHCIRPWHRRFEASIQRNLLTKTERAEGIYVKFLDGELLRGAAKDRAEYYAKALGAGGSPAWLTQNDVRELEDMDKDPDPQSDKLARPTTASTGNPAIADSQGAPNGTP